MENNIITLHPTKLVAVVVPEDAEKFAFGYDTPNWLYYYLKDSHNSFDHRHIELPNGNYKVLGTVTREGVLDFEPEPHVAGNNAGQSDTMWQDYKLGNVFGMFQCNSPTNSFLSLFPANGVYLKNPMGDEPEEMPNKSDLRTKIFIMNKIDNWKSYQSKTLPEEHKFLILTTKTP